jgi:tetratricopeptide (TPR) repeat protein
MNQDKIEKIEKYLLGRLSKEDKLAFETEINNDPKLAAEVELEKELIDMVSDQEMLAFRNNLESISNSKTTRPTNWSSLYWLIPALLLLFMLFFFSPVKKWFFPESSTNLYQAYYETPKAQEFLPPALFGSRQSNEEQNLPSMDQLKAVLNAYSQGNHAVALDIFTSIPTYENAAQYNYQYAVLLMANDDFKNAIEAFELAKSYNENGSLWYQALAYIQQNQNSLAQNNLRQIIDNPVNPWQAKAKKLLQLL